MVWDELLFGLVLDALSPTDFDPTHHSADANATHEPTTLPQLLEHEASRASAAANRIATRLLPLYDMLDTSRARATLALLFENLLQLPTAVLPRGSDAGRLCSALRDALTWARRTNRWLSGASPLLALALETSALRAESRLGHRALLVGAELAALAYSAVDQTRWLQQLGLASGEPRATARYAARYLVFRRVFNIAYLLACLSASPVARARIRAAFVSATGNARWDMLPRLRASFRDAEAEDERARFRALLREFALLLHAYHESGIFRTHASFVGLLGFAVAVADLRTMWESARADDQQSTWGAGRLFSRALEPNDDLPLSSCFPALSWEERILGFLSCYAIGTVLSLSAFTSMHALMNGNPAPFAIRYTAGNLLSIVSTSFIVGPRTQIRKMTASVRIGATGLYFGTIVTTLVCAFFREPTLTLASMVFQFIALAWYCLSYIPFGRGMLKRLVRWFC